VSRFVYLRCCHAKDGVDPVDGCRYCAWRARPPRDYDYSLSDVMLDWPADGQMHD